MAALRRDETGPIHTRNLVIPTSYIYMIPSALYFEQTRPGIFRADPPRPGTFCSASHCGERHDVRQRAPIDRDSLVEFEIRLRKQRDGGAFRLRFARPPKIPL